MGTEPEDASRSTVYLVRSDAPPDDVAALADVIDVHQLEPGLALVEATLSRSRLYHEVKWVAPDDTPLLVVELLAEPKLKGMAAGSVTWIRDRLHDGSELT